MPARSKLENKKRGGGGDNPNISGILLKKRLCQGNFKTAAVKCMQ